MQTKNPKLEMQDFYLTPKSFKQVSSFNHGLFGGMRNSLKLHLKLLELKSHILTRYLDRCLNFKGNFEFGQSFVCVCAVMVLSSFTFKKNNSTVNVKETHISYHLFLFFFC